MTSFSMEIRRRKCFAVYSEFNLQARITMAVTDSAPDSLTTNIKVTWESKTAAGMSEATLNSQTFLCCVTTHLQVCVTVSIQPLCQRSSGSGPDAAELLSRGNFCPAWWLQRDMASSRGSVRALGKGSSSLCVRVSGIMVPGHLHCPQV